MKQATTTSSALYLRSPPPICRRASPVNAVGWGLRNGPCLSDGRLCRSPRPRGGPRTVTTVPLFIKVGGDAICTSHPQQQQRDKDQASLCFLILIPGLAPSVPTVPQFVHASGSREVALSCSVAEGPVDNSSLYSGVCTSPGIGQFQLQDILTQRHPPLGHLARTQVYRAAGPLADTTRPHQNSARVHCRNRVMGNIEPLADHPVHNCDGLILFPFGGVSTPSSLGAPGARALGWKTALHIVSGICHARRGPMPGWEKTGRVLGLDALVRDSVPLTASSFSRWTSRQDSPPSLSCSRDLHWRLHVPCCWGSTLRGRPVD